MVSFAMIELTVEGQPIGRFLDELAVPTEIVHADPEQTNRPAPGVGSVEQLYCPGDERRGISGWRGGLTSGDCREVAVSDLDGHRARVESLALSHSALSRAMPAISSRMRPGSVRSSG